MKELKYQLPGDAQESRHRYLMFWLIIVPGQAAECEDYKKIYQVKGTPLKPKFSTTQNEFINNLLQVIFHGPTKPFGESRSKVQKRDDTLTVTLNLSKLEKTKIAIKKHGKSTEFLDLPDLLNQWKTTKKRPKKTTDNSSVDGLTDIEDTSEGVSNSEKRPRDRSTNSESRPSKKSKNPRRTEGNLDRRVIEFPGHSQDGSESGEATERERQRNKRKKSKKASKNGGDETDCSDYGVPWRSTNRYLGDEMKMVRRTRAPGAFTVPSSSTDESSGETARRSSA
jgi:hypothetical protein